MSEDGRNSQKKSWKAFQANYDDVFALSDRLCSYCLTDQMVEAMLTMTEYLKWPTRWVSETTDIERDKIDAFASQLEWRLMNGCCDDNLPIQWRYSPDGVLQQSTNGGGTWVDAPLYDPRVYSVQFPPLAGTDGNDKKCLAATGAAALVKEQVGDQLTDGMSRYTLSQLITDWVGTVIQSSNPFEALLTVISNQIFALVIAALRPALTTTVYHIFKCILYCRMSADASFTDAQWASVRSDITDQIGGIAGIFLEHLVYLLGTAGLTNLSRAGGAATGDCSDCAACPSNCDPTGWFVGFWYGDTRVENTAATGTFVSAGADYVIAQSTDRGDGQQVLTFSVEDRFKCCTIKPEFVGTAPASTLHNYNNCPAEANYLTQTPDDAGPTCRSATAWYFQMSSGGPWQIKFNFVDEC